MTQRTPSPAEQLHQGGGRGDVTATAAGQPVDRVDVIYEALDGARAGGGLELTIVRGTDERTVQVGL